MLKSLPPLLLSRVACDDVVAPEPGEKLGQEFIHGAVELEPLVVGDDESASLDGGNFLLTPRVGIVGAAVHVEESVYPVVERLFA